MNKGIFHTRQVGQERGKGLRRAGGFSLVSAIFLLVILAGLGVAIVSIFNAQQTGSSMDVQGERAYQAARAGIEWGLFQQTQNGYCNAIPSVSPFTPATIVKSFTLPSGSTLSSFTVTVQCTYQPALAVATSGFTNTGNPVTVTTAAAHNFLPGAQITIHNVLPAAYNTGAVGAAVLTTPTTTTFTYQLATAPSGAITQQGVVTQTNMDRWLLVATACNQPITGWTATSIACPNSAPTSPDYVQRTAQAQL